MLAWLMAFAASMAPAASPIAETPYLQAQQRVALPDGRRINVYCTGRGSPTVILEGGWTTETSYWRKVQPLLSKRSQVCSYDRAGYGFSDPGPLPRTAAAIERDFAQLIDALKIRWPIILMAHSLGSFPARLYAARHPARVAALILLDPSAEDRPEPTDYLASVVACSRTVITDPLAKPVPPTCLSSPSPTMPDSFNQMRSAMQRAAAYQQAAVSELQEMYGTSADQVRASRHPLGAMPLIVLTAGDAMIKPGSSKEDNADARQAQWAAQARIAALSNRSVHRLLTGASHFIPMERPADAVAAVDEARAMVTAKVR